MNLRFILIGIQLVMMWGLLALPSRAYQLSPEHSGMMHGSEVAQASPEDQAKLEADKRFSEFNHHFAGIFVLLVGLLALLEPHIISRVPTARYLWSAFFFIPGIYLFFFSDPESWPFGGQTLQYVVTQNLQVLQHKIFSLILLGLAVVEYLRASYRLKSWWANWLFPAMAAAGAGLLLVHSPQAHIGGIGESAHLAMQNVEHQHINFAVAGFGVAVTKALTDTKRFHPTLMRYLFSLCLVSLGVLLILYTE